MPSRRPRTDAPRPGTGAPGTAVRVVLASRLFAPEPAAAAFRLRALALALAAGGAQVEVLTGRLPRGVPAAAPDAGVRVRRWPVLRDRSGAVRGYLQYASFDVPLLLRLLLARRPDVVVVEPPPTTGAVAALACALRGVPYAYYAADLLSVAAAGSGAPAAVVLALRALESAVLRRAARVLTVSPQVARRIEDMGVAPERVEVVGTGVDTTAFRPPEPGSDPASDAASDLGAGPGLPPGPLLVYAGTMSEVHGAEVFLDAFAAVAADHPAAHLLMLGGGVDRERLAERAARLLPGRVSLPGTVPADRVAAALGRAHAGLASVRPGSGYEFAHATKVFAATACGARVVYAGPGPCADLVREHDLGWAVPWEAPAVAEALAEALATPPDPAQRRRIAAWTREGASLQAVAARAAALVRAVAAAGAVPAGRARLG